MRDRIECIKLDYGDRRSWPQDNTHIFGFVKSNLGCFQPHWAVLYVRLQYGHLELYRAGKDWDRMLHMDKYAPNFCYRSLVTVTHYYAMPEIYKVPRIKPQRRVR